MRAERMRMVALAVSVFALVSCDMTETTDYHDLIGQYSGRTNSVAAETVELVAVATIDVVTQVDGELSGTFGFSGLLGGTLISFDQAFSGTVEMGENPPVSLKLDTGCGVVTELSGDYESAQRKLMLTGIVGMVGERCGIWQIGVEVEVGKEPGT